ncbi:MAG: type II toxin-antitoxin system death-on-curing family toxin [Rhodospirillaceae bacterium]|nr:type II toxin-antitoxin system death-on-curing family toxin [Rhodospirillaceae bacterium]
MTWQWIAEEVILAIHGEQLAEHGGPDGVRDRGLLQSALARPQNVVGYKNSSPDAADLAACYGFGIVRNHPFVDGNKRVALVVVELFLALNGFDLIAEDASCVTAVLGLADGSISEEAFSAWLRGNLKKV